jgi:hypothetical protein
LHFSSTKLLMYLEVRLLPHTKGNSLPSLMVAVGLSDVLELSSEIITSVIANTKAGKMGHFNSRI